MRRSTRRLFALLALLPILLFGLAGGYMLGMEHLEGSPRSLGRAIQFVAETLTSTGYGADNQWDHGLMQVLVVLIQFTGLGLAFLVFPIFVIPFIEERFEARLAQTLPDLEGAVLVYRWGPAVAPLVERLERLQVPVVVLEEDVTTARRLRERGHKVVHARLEEEELDFSRVVGARGVVAAGDDPHNAALTLAVRQRGFTGPIAALVGTPARRAAMQRTGATAVFTPEHVLAAALAARASAKISPRVSGAQSLGGHLQITEVRLDRGSPLAGKTLAESNLRAETGTTVVGWWRDGQLEPPPGPGVRLELGAILVAAGNDAGIAKLEGLATPMPSSGQMVVVGQDRVAHKVAEFLSDAGEEVRRVSPAPVDGALIGDPLDPDVLERSGVREARAVVLALDTDGETLFAAALVRDLAPEATVVAAARRAENVGRIRRAGADFALSVGQVAGQLLVYQLLGQESVALEAEIQMVRAAAGELAGGKLADARVRQITGCTVVAVERADDVIAGVSGDFRVRAGDVLYITGASTDVDRFFDSFPGTRPTRADA